MNLPDTSIPLKTEQGRVNFENKSLNGNLRRLFLMIDGKKSIKELLEFSPIFGGPSSFDELFKLKFIEFSGDTHPHQNYSRTDDLFEAIKRPLQETYGPGIVQELKKVEKAFPPEIDPILFLDQCREKAGKLLGREQLDDIFGPLYSRFR